MRKVSLFDIVITMMLVGVAAWANAWANSSHSAVKAAIGSPQIDLFSPVTNAKNLPSQESLNLKVWPDNGVVRY